MLRRLPHWSRTLPAHTRQRRVGLQVPGHGNRAGTDDGAGKGKALFFRLPGSENERCTRMSVVPINLHR